MKSKCLLYVSMLLIAAAASSGVVTGKVLTVSSATGEMKVSSQDNVVQTFGIGGAHITQDGRSASIADIRIGHTVRVSYESPGVAMSVLTPASAVQIIRFYPSIEPSLGYDKVGRIVTIRGYVSYVEADISILGLSTPYGLITVHVPSYADVRSFGRGMSLMSVRTGTYAIATGRLEQPTVMTANTINIGGPDSGAGTNVATLLSGTVIREADFMTRSLTLNTVLGDKLMQVAPGARVTRHGYLISTYDLRYGDQLQAIGCWSGGVYIATQVDVFNDGPGYSWHDTGRIISIDAIHKEFVFDIGGQNVLVGASDADIWLGGMHKRFSDLTVGMHVTVYGAQWAGRIDATRIEILATHRGSP